MFMTDDLNQQLKQLAFRKIDQIIQSFAGEIQAESVPVIHEFFHLYLEDNRLLQHLYQAYKENLPSLNLHHQQDIITYKHEGAAHTILFSNKQFTLDEDSYVRLLAYTIEIMREVLPLGSIVELNPAYFKPDSQLESPSKVVITGRFIGPKGYNSYFPYVGVIYPVGEMKAGTQIHFTAPLIKRVVQKGFSDGMEEAFVYLMKQEFIVEKDLNSIEFSNHDMKKFQQEMEQKAGDV